MTTTRDALLTDLRTRFPNGVSSVELLDTYGPAAKTRIGELRRDGWAIDTTAADGVAVYTLLSLAQGNSDNTLAGCVIRLSERGWSSRTHKDAALHGTGDLLERAEAAALAAYRAVLAGEGHGRAAASAAAVPPEPVDDRIDFLDFLDLGL
jgi:hypothetical protein